MKKSDSVLIFAKNIDYGYTLEPPQSVGSSSKQYKNTKFRCCTREKEREKAVHTCSDNQTNEPRHEKTNILHMRKQRRREADQRLCFRYIESTIPLLSKSKISSL